MEKKYTEFTDTLFEAILTLKSVQECYDFFEDICTVKEIQTLSQRLEVAKLLQQNKSYIEISKETGCKHRYGKPREKVLYLRYGRL